MAATLLLADDSVTIQRVIELTFADEDIRVLVASDGQQAIQKIDSDRPDIVLADIGMPRVDGYAVATHVKESASLKHIPVLLLTGAFEPIDEARARKTGCDGVLVKPFEPQKLVARVKELLGGARGAEMWPANMPRTQADSVKPTHQVHLPPVEMPRALPEPMQAEAVRPMPELLRAEQFEVAAPPLSVPTAPAPVAMDEFDPAIEPAGDVVFEFGETVAARAEIPAHAEPPAALEGNDVANRNGDYDFRQSRAELPPPADRLETELDMLDAALSRLDPTANPHELDEETASDFARDLKEMRNEARQEDADAARPVRPSFGTWDLPTPSNNDTRAAVPIDIVAEEIPLQQSAPPAPPVTIPAPVVHTPVVPAPVVAAPPAPAPVAFSQVAPAAAPAPVVAAPAPVVQVPQPVPVVPQAPPAPAARVPVTVAAPAQTPAAPAPPAEASPKIERPTLASAFSALLAAEKSRPAAQAAAPQISEAAIEEVVKRVLTRMAGDTVNRVVLETAERLIREEISRTKDPSGR